MPFRASKWPMKRASFAVRVYPSLYLSELHSSVASLILVSTVLRSGRHQCRLYWLNQGCCGGDCIPALSEILFLSAGPSAACDPEEMINELRVQAGPTRRSGCFDEHVVKRGYALTLPHASR